MNIEGSTTTPPSRPLRQGASLRQEGAVLHLTAVHTRSAAAALNTTRWWRHEDGQLSATQVERVAQRLALARPGQRRVVMVHQPLVVTRPEDEKNLLHGHDAAKQAWGAAGVDLIVGGHIHLPFVLPLASGGWAVQAGTAVSSRVRSGAGNSVNLIHIDAAATERAVVERWDHDPAKRGYVPVSSTTFGRRSAGVKACAGIQFQAACRWPMPAFNRRCLPG